MHQGLDGVLTSDIRVGDLGDRVSARTEIALNRFGGVRIVRIGDICRFWIALLVELRV